MNIKLYILVGITLLCFPVSDPAQTETPPPSTPIVRSRGIKNFPYSAEATSETIQTLCDGNRIIRNSKQRLFRDSEGRTRTEIENEEGDNIRKSIRISDPVAGVTYSINPVNKTVYRRLISIEPRNYANVSRPRGYSSKSEKLDGKIIEGIESTGSRIITTVAPGTIGNEKELQTIGESWFSPELMIVVYSKRIDPASGDYTLKLNNIKREEPDSTLFIVPPDYKVIEQDPEQFSTSNSFIVPKP